MSRMGRLLDNLPEKDVGRPGHCTAPSTHCVSKSATEVELANSRPRQTRLKVVSPTKPTEVSGLAPCLDSDSANCETRHVQSASVSFQPHRCSGGTELGRVSASGAQTELRSTTCSGPESSQPQLPRVGHLSPNSTFNVKDLLPSCVTCSSGSSAVLSCVSVLSNGPACVTTSSSSGRGGLSAFDSGTQSPNGEGLDRLMLNSTHPRKCQPHTCNGPLISNERQPRYRH